MNFRLKQFAVLLVVGALLVGAPLLGVLVAGHELAPYLQTPPPPHHEPRLQFSLTAFVILAVLGLVVMLIFDDRVLRHRKTLADDAPPAKFFPWWGWAGLVLGLGAWALAWTRFAWFAPWQRYIFTPQWLGYILVVNGLTYRRTGGCLLTHLPLFFALLFPLSAAFWWFFEWLNRFAQNWFYVDLGPLSAGEYVLFATLPFATVLPAVLSTAELLETAPKSAAGLDRFVALKIAKPKRVAAVAFAVGLFGLALMGVWPAFLFPLLWLAPLAALTAARVFQGQETIFQGLEKGDWRRIYRLAVAGLICGFFWECWNYFSLAKWIYDVPWVGRAKLFEMPVLGYAGYLPFGWTCAALGDWLAELLKSRVEWSEA
ncbi:MAG: hypothetical protein EPN23_01680 [Verrucomicrobia bacterium]|nr:MAG: hypothetical protein EPN23_01680 [Verrucomicrobiota bacterium]